jgi:hypothetical protein
MGIVREVRRHPVEQHAQACRMRAVDEAAQPRAVAVARGGRVQAQRLVAPGAVEGVLADRQQLEVGEAQPGGIGQQRLGQLVPVQPAVLLFGHAAPRRQVDLVDADRRGMRVGGAAPLVGRAFPGQGCHHAGGQRPQFGRERIGVGFQGQQVSIAVEQLVLVARPGADGGQEDLPYAALAPQAHAVAAPVPLVEVADHADTAGVRGPDGKRTAVHAFDAAQMRAQDLERAQVRALGEQPCVELPEQGAEAVGVIELGAAAVGPTGPQPIGPGRIMFGLEDAFGVPARQLSGPTGRQQRQGDGAGHERPHPIPGAGVDMRAEHAERVGMPALGQRDEVLRIEHQRRTSRCQTWWAYSRIVRSDENGPMPATLSRALRAQWRGWRNTSSTRRLGAHVGREVGQQHVRVAAPQQAVGQGPVAPGFVGREAAAADVVEHGLECGWCS